MRTTILFLTVNSTSEVSIANWPEYKFHFTEFFFTNFLPILLTGLITILITIIYDNFRASQRNVESSLTKLSFDIYRFSSMINKIHSEFYNVKDNRFIDKDYILKGTESLFENFQDLRYEIEHHIAATIKNMNKKQKAEFTPIANSIFDVMHEVSIIQLSFRESFDMMTVQRFINQLHLVPFEKIRSIYLEFRRYYLK